MALFGTKKMRRTEKPKRK